MNLYDIVSEQEKHHRKRMIASLMKTNSFLAWVFDREHRELNHYYDMSIELDFIREVRKPYEG